MTFEVARIDTWHHRNLAASVEQTCYGPITRWTASPSADEIRTPIGEVTCSREAGSIHDAVVQFLRGSGYYTDSMFTKFDGNTLKVIWRQQDIFIAYPIF